MRILEELRVLDTGDPGKWSTRVSLVLACALFTLVAGLGIQLWVRGQLMPQLAHARDGLHDLEQKLAAARLTERQRQLLHSETDQAIEQLRRSGAWIPPGPEALDLTVSLAAGWAKALVYAVQPWQPAREFDRALRHTGAELEISASYGEILGFLGLALASEQLREMVEINMELPSLEDPEELRATARLLAYFADDATAEQFQSPVEKQSRQPPPSLPAGLANLRSPFGPAASAAEAIHAADSEETEEALQGSGLIRVGARSYELVEDPAGNLRLKPGGS